MWTGERPPALLMPTGVLRSERLRRHGCDDPLRIFVSAELADGERSATVLLTFGGRKVNGDLRLKTDVAAFNGLGDIRSCDRLGLAHGDTCGLGDGCEFRLTHGGERQSDHGDEGCEV